MIHKVVRGYRPGGLLAYLFGPGRYEEHQNPRVVASWDGAPWLHQPDRVGSGEFDVDLRDLIAVMSDAPARAGLPLSNPPALPEQWADLLARGQRLPVDAPAWARLYRWDPVTGEVVLRQGHVWHCALRLAPGDLTLTDQQWEHIAGRVMRAVGIDQAGCRWVAVRHADDHVHLMATLVSEITGKRFHPFRDWLQLRTVCRELEREYGLTVTAPVDKTARRAPSRGEIAKTARSQRVETSRDELHRVVSQAAAATRDEDEFFTWLRHHGIDTRARVDESGRVCGYSVARPGDVNRRRQPIRYSGGTLAPDLSLPRLHTRWAALPAPQPPYPRKDALTEVAAVVQQTADLLRQHRTAHVGAGRHAAPIGTAPADGVDGTSGVDEVAHATGEVLRVFAAAMEDPTLGPLTRVGHSYDRATRTPHHVLPPGRSALARELRGAARRLAAVGAISGRLHGKFTVAALTLALASLVAEIAAWQPRDRRPRHRTVGRDTATALTQLAPATPAQTAAPAAEPLLSAVPPAPSWVTTPVPSTLGRLGAASEGQLPGRHRR